MIDIYKSKLIIICGPTGVGKTALSLEMAERFGGGIIGADSMQIYRYMDIGTAKPTKAEQIRVSHHMIDIVTPDAEYDAARYCREAREAAAGLDRQGRIPLAVGGTGFYIKALLYGLFDSAPTDDAIREKLRTEAGTEGGEALHRRLAAMDPASAARIHANDTYRVIRALEVFECTGLAMSRYQDSHRFADEPFNVLKIGLNRDREILYKRIDCRVEQMMKDGLIEEVRHLLEMGYSEKHRSMQALGYRHVLDLLAGRTPHEEMIEHLKRDTRHYAKRQLTWFRKDKEMHWHSPEDIKAVAERIGRFLEAPGYQGPDTAAFDKTCR
jgi:tRNA dimethylallyltransferase